jgi:Regulator of G protein signaling domain
VDLNHISILQHSMDISRNELSPTGSAVPVYTRTEQQDSTQQQRSTDQTPPTKAIWFMNHRGFLSPCFLASVLFGCIAVIIALAIVINEVEPVEQNAGPKQRCEYDFSVYPFAFSTILWVIIFSFFAFKLRAVVDAFRINAELRSTAYASFAIVLVWLLFYTIGDDMNREVFPLSTTAACIGVLVLVTMSTYFPLFWLRQVRRTLDNPAPLEKLHTLQAVLSDTEARALFRSHLCTEFAVENISFWQHVDRFTDRDFDRKEDMVLEAWIIYDKYVAEDALFLVNLPAQTVDHVRNVFAPIEQSSTTSREPSASNTDVLGFEISDQKQIDPDAPQVELRAISQADLKRLCRVMDQSVFNEAQQAIFDLMNRDSFPRFIHSAPFRRMYENRVTARVEEDELVSSILHRASSAGSSNNRSSIELNSPQRSVGAAASP